MAVINHSKKEINAKIVYFGPPGSGKGSLFRFIHQRIKPSLCGPLKSMPTAGANLIFFDYIPFENATIDGCKVRLHLYTLSGRVDNPAAWKMILKGVDGISVVLENGVDKIAENAEAMLLLRSVITSYGRSPDSLPMVLNYSKSDLSSRHQEEKWHSEYRYIEKIQSSIVTGEGVINSIVSLSRGVFRQIQDECSAIQSPEEILDTSGSKDLPDPIESQTEDDCVIEIQEFKEDTCQIKAKVLSGVPSVIRIPLLLDIDGVTRSVQLRMEVSVEEEDAG